MRKLQILLRCLAKGDKTIFETPSGEYMAIQMKGHFAMPEGTEERDIVGRIQYEIFGEYPLSENKQGDWDRNIKGAFKINY